MNKISTLSTLAHLCLWQSQCQDFPNSSHGQKRAELKEAWGSENPPFIPQTTAKGTRIFVASRFGGLLCAGFSSDCSYCSRVCKICWECWVSSHLKGLKRWRTPVRILDVHFYCYRKHLGQMLPCSELTCTFQTGQSFPISAWEQRASRRERERDY